MKDSLTRRAEATPRVQLRKGRIYWEPSESLRRAGFKNRALGLLTRDALNAADELNNQADLHMAGKTAARPTANTIAAVLDDHEKSATFLALRASTRRHKLRHHRLIKAKLGKDHPDQLTPGQVEKWFWEMGGGSDARNIIDSLRGALGRAQHDGKVRVNGAAKAAIGARKRRNRIATRDEIWAMIGAAEKLGRFSVAGFAIMAIATMQREADVLSYTRDQIDDGALYLVQQKTGKRLSFRLHPLIIDRLGLTDGGAGAILMNEMTALPYHERAFQRAWEAVRKAAAKEHPSLTGDDPSVRDPNLQGPLFASDLRRTGMVWAAENGATVPQIVAVSGHSIDEGYAILEVYLPRTRLLADKAVLAIDFTVAPTLEEIGQNILAA